MIGRDAHIAEIRRLLGAAPEAPRAVFLTGAAGIGKTTLLDFGRDRALESGYLVLSCAGLQSDMPVGFADLHGLLYPILDRAARLPERQRRALASAFGAEPEVAADPLLIRLAVVGLLEEAAARRRVVLVADDWQWLDPSTRAVLTFVVQHLVGDGIVLLAAVRVEDGGDFVVPGGKPVGVPALSRPESEALIARLGEPLAAPQRDLIVRFAQGNPLALGEFRHAANSGEPLEKDRLPVTARLERAFASEVRSLTDRSRQLLLLAVAGGGISVSELMTAGAAIGAGAGDLDVLERSGLLSTAGGRLRFRHPLVRSTVYGRTSLTERIAAHRTLAATVTDRSRRAWHRAGATIGRDDGIARELEDAAGDLDRRGALPEAAAALSRAAELSTDPRDRARRLVAAAERARRAGLTELVAARLDEARPLTDDPVVRLALHTVHASTVAFSSASRPDLQPFADFARLLAGRAADQFDEEQLKLLWPMAPLVWLYDGSGRVVRQTIEAVLAIETPCWSPSKWLLLLVLDPARFAGEMRPRVAELLAVWERDPAALPVNFAHALSALQRVTVATGVHEKARDMLRRGGSVADEARHEVALATARNVLGEPRAALANAEVGIRLSEALNLPMQAAAGHAAQAVAHAWLGDAAATRAAVDASERLAPAAWPIVQAHRQWAAGLLALSERRHREAWEHLRRTSVHRTTHLWAIADLTEAAVHAGAGQDVLSELRGDVAAFDSPELTALYERARALADEPAAEAHFERALAEGRRAGVDIQLARTHLAYGQWLRRERRVLDARHHLEEARRLFGNAGAVLWAGHAVTELRASGVRAAHRPVSPRPGTLEALTEQEMQIATLAARGLSNKEIADRLYMSPRTVGSHLYRVFPKLQVTRRQQLRDAIHA